MRVHRFRKPVVPLKKIAAMSDLRLLMHQRVAVGSGEPGSKT
jgi:hypothetical protein